jgi:hypothetical protein
MVYNPTFLKYILNTHPYNTAEAEPMTKNIKVHDDFTPTS